MSVAEDLKNRKPTEAEQEQALVKKEQIKRRVKRIVDALERPAVSLPLVLTLRERLALPRPETAWRITDVQGAGHRVLLAAQFKAGKTTFVVNLIRSLVDGDPFLNSYQVIPVEGTVALFDFEMSDRQLDDWYRVHGILNDDRVLVIPMRGATSTFDLQDEHWRKHWVEFLKAHKVEYLVLDCLRPVLDALGLNEHTETGLFLTAFDQLLREAGIPEALVVHHMGHQNERARGDSRLLDWPDVGWTLVREKGEDGVDDPFAPRFFKAYGRDVDVAETALAYESSTRKLSIEGGGSRRDVKSQAASDAVLHFIRQAETPPTATEVEKAVMLDGHTQKSIRNALHEGIKLGLILKKPGEKKNSFALSVVPDVDIPF
jgi:hypothetical protein